MNSNKPPLEIVIYNMVEDCGRKKTEIAADVGKPLSTFSREVSPYDDGEAGRRRMSADHDSLCFSFHAVKRCIERGISEQNIFETITLGQAIADDGDTAVYARGRMRVVVGSGALVITAYRERKRNPKRRIKKKRKMQRQVARALR